MTEPSQFTIGAEARCSDGVCGEVTRVVVDPVARAVTHLVVEPKHRQGLGRLVPLDLVEDTTDGVLLRCTTAGVYVRIAQRLLAMATAIWHNWATSAPVKRCLISYDN